MDLCTAAATLPQWLQTVYPFRLRSVDVGTERMSCVEEGSNDAPPLVFVHGSPVWSFVWRNVIPQVSRRFHVIAPDNIGFGLSSKPKFSGYHTLERHIENLAALIDGLNLRKVTLVGNGWGGIIALGYALRNPENVSRILLVNSWVDPRTALALPWQMRLTASKVGEPLSFVGNILFSACLGRLTHKPLLPDVRAGYSYPLVTAADRIGMLEFCRMHLMRPGDRDYDTLEGINAGLSSLKARVEILWGSKDPMLRGKLLPYLLRDSLPNVSEPRLLPNAGHLVAEDEPSAVSGKLLEVFKPKPAAPVFNILR